MKILIKLDKNNEIVSYCLIGQEETEYPKDYICVDLDEKYVSKIEENYYEVNQFFRKNLKKFRVVESKLLIDGKGE